MFNFKPKTEKIYKFVYQSMSGFSNGDKRTMLFTGCNPPEAVKKI